MTNQQVLTEKELASKLGLSPWTVRAMRLKEGCPHFTVGKRIFYRLEVVLSWISQREQGTKNAISETEEIGKIRRIQ